MLTQLDLFGAPAGESNKPAPGRKRLSPPAVVELSQETPETSTDSAPKAETRITVVMPEVEAAPASHQEPELQRTMSAGVTVASNEAAAVQEINGADLAHASESMDELPRKSSRGRKSVKEMSREASLIELPSDEQLYSKQYYAIGEVAAMFHVNASLLRFWEAEFDILKPRKNKKGDRFFRPEDIKNLQLIHHLLRERKYTIDGARDFLRKSGKRKEQFEAIESLKKIRAFLLELKAGL